MTFEYKTEGKAVLETTAAQGKTAVLMWEVDSGVVRLCSGDAVVRLSQNQVADLGHVLDRIWNDIGPQKHPTPESGK